MTLTLADAPEVAALPVAATAPPASIERVTPLRTALGLADQAGSGVMLQAETLVCAHPASPIALARLAQAAQAAGQHDQACEAARAAIEAAGQLADPRRGRHAVYAAALVLAAHGQEDSAAALAGSGLPGASIARAGISAQAGQLELALQQLAGSDSPLADAMRGWLLLQSAPSEGVRALRAAVKGGLRTPEVLVNLGYGLAAVGALRKAVDVTREATYLAPALTVAAYNLTSFLHRQRRDGDALAELSRIAAIHPDDADLAVCHAWGYVSLARDPQRALRQLKVVRDRLWWSAEPDRRAALEASVAYLEYRLGRQSIDNATRQLAQCLKASGPSREVLMMLASLYNESEDAKELKRLLDANTGVLPPAQLDLLQSRLACLQGDIDRGAQLAVQAADSDTFGTDAAGWAASLLGETSGDYARAVEIAGRTYDKNPDLYLLNSLAFVSALAGRHREATKAIAEAGGREVLPFHGATAALVDLAAGRLEEGLAGYQQAVDGIRRGGDPEMAGLVDWRRRLATRQLGWPLPSGENLDEPPGSKYRVVRATLRRVAGRLEEPKR